MKTEITAKVVAYVILGLAYILGCGSLGLFGLFLWAGARPVVNLNLGTATALAFDALLSLAFFLQHSGMIRKPFRTRLAALLPVHYHSAVYAIASGVVLFLLLVLWQPLRLDVFSVGGAPLCWLVRGVFMAAMAGMVWAFGSLGSSDLIGRGPILAYLRGVPARPVPLATRGPYRWVRHPIYALTLLMIWAAPDVTADRLLFNVLWTTWILAGTLLEERDLAAEFGEAYVKYQRRVPMLVPRSLRPRM